MSWSFVSSCRATCRALGRSVALGAALMMMVPAWASEPVVKLINAGTGAKKEIRVAPKAGSTETFEMLMNMSMSLDMGGMQQLPQTVPPIAMVMAANVKKVEPNGNIHYDFELKDSKVRGAGDPAVIAAVDGEMKKMIGTKGSVVVSNRGVTVSSALTPPPGVPPEQFGNLQKGMQHASAPFPVEPVGVGAVWEVTTKVSDGGIALTQVATYTLESWSGDTVTLKTSLVQKADPQKVNAPGMPPGASADLKNLDGKGTGTTTVHLGHLFPTSGKLDHDMTTRMSIAMEGQSMDMGMGMKLGLEMARK